MALAETYHHEEIHARWAHARRYMIMTRLVSLVIFLTSGLFMHTVVTKTGSDAMHQFDQSSTVENR